MGVCLVSLVCLLLAPNTFLRFLRIQYPWIGWPMNWIEAHSASINLAHVIAFVALGFAVKLGMAVRTRYVLALIATLSVASEIAQFWVPGRTPRLTDAGVDVAGALAGIALARLVLWMRARARGE
ncbi:VanZ family protein [Ramlibacter alkalitolerans]|uniref:VanZ family protein n=1 Tax=Ramlibacter alkalitolerans TaxID=2039631 RepID=A0ABS1JNR8_9BURK|nr:VanZ family protein [Ramlibacter alkalitolerans]MBL0425781.1 VanZ family protein [Ramlibacter alkalitolerans]